MKPATINIEVTRGDTYRETFTWRTGSLKSPVDLTGATAKMQVRDANDVLKFELTDSDGLTLGGTAGTVAVNVSSIRNALTPGTYYHDLEVTLASGDVNTIVKGTYRVTKDITHA